MENLIKTLTMLLISHSCFTNTRFQGCKLLKGGKKLLFFLCMQRFLSLKEKNSTLLILLRFVFWVLFSVEESASPQLISIKVEEMKVDHYNHDTGAETFFVVECSVHSNPSSPGDNLIHLWWFFQALVSCNLWIASPVSQQHKGIRRPD